MFNYIDVTNVTFSVKDGFLYNPMLRCYRVSGDVHAKSKLYCLYVGETDRSIFSYIDVTNVTFSVKDGFL